ncbi:MAG TPA: hypothetical protein VGK10_02260 [Prolixibacteraceae bacterium]|jgi:hypothetical protein
MNSKHVMKKYLFLLLNICVLASCSVSNRIIKTDEPKGFKLIQSPKAYSSPKVGTTPGPSKVKITATYLFEEKQNTHPETRVNFSISPLSQALARDSKLSVNLDGETIELGTADQATVGWFLLPENLWVSMVYSQKIHFILDQAKDKIEIVLNQSEKNKLTEFFRLAIEQRDIQFPALPEGLKKW